MYGLITVAAGTVCVFQKLKTVYKWPVTVAVKICLIHILFFFRAQLKKFLSLYRPLYNNTKPILWIFVPFPTSWSACSSEECWRRSYQHHRRPRPLQPNLIGHSQLFLKGAWQTTFICKNPVYLGCSYFS